MKVALVHNPGAGHGRVSDPDLGDLLRSHGYEPVRVPPEADFADVARSERVGFAVVAGGDGTLRKAALALVGSGVPVAPLPLGTANNISHTLGITGDPAQIVAGWSLDHLRALDVGLASGPWGRTRFLEGCGIGLVGRGISVIEETDEATSRTFSDPEDKLHRDLSVFIALVEELVPVRTRLALDDWRGEDDYLLIEVMNIQHAGPRIQLTRCADPSDGCLDVVVATDVDRERLRHSLKTSLAGRVPDPVLDTRKSRTVQLTFAGADFRVDDEVVMAKPPRGQPPVRVNVALSVLPGALSLLVPPHANGCA